MSSKKFFLQICFVTHRVSFDWETTEKGKKTGSGMISAKAADISAMRIGSTRRRSELFLFRCEMLRRSGIIVYVRQS